MRLISMISTVLLVALVTFAGNQLNAQAGIAITAGVGGAKNHLEDVSTGYGTGYTGAIEARFLGQDMYFDVQLGYGKYKLITKDNFEFATDNNNFQVFHGRIGMGFTIWRIGYNTLLRAKILGSLDKNIEYTSKLLVDAGYTTMNSTVGVVGGLGIDFHRIVLDLEYERGLINALYKVEGSNFDYLGLRVGVLIN